VNPTMMEMRTVWSCLRMTGMTIDALPKTSGSVSSPRLPALLSQSLFSPSLQSSGDFACTLLVFQPQPPSESPSVLHWGLCDPERNLETLSPVACLSRGIRSSLFLYGCLSPSSSSRPMTSSK
jgi:hypothetical protein